MAQFLDLFGFLSVVLRAATLSLGTVAVGGVVFAFIAQRGLPLPKSARRLLWISAFGLAATQVLYVAANSTILRAATELRFSELIGASYFLWGCVTASAAFTLGIVSMRRASRIGALELGCSLVILGAAVATSHAAARLEHRIILLTATAVHQLASAAWIGGLPYLLLTLRGCAAPPDALAVCKRFSALALVSVMSLFGAGLLLSLFYIGDSAALYGTTYGIMVVAKALLFGMVLTLGATNFRLIRSHGQDGSDWLKPLSRISEAEIGIGMTVIFAAASLTSQPPAIDLTDHRVDLSTIAQRFSPKIPRMRTPPLSTLSPVTRELWKEKHPSNMQPYIPNQEQYVPPTEGDIAWSEYNHHWAGLVVLVMGVLALLSRRFVWARHWPVAFLGLAVFLLLRADPENWPLGPSGFWESFTSADVAQHRVFVLLIVLFAAFEWGVQTRRLKAPMAALVFPAVCAVGGALLLTHMHALTNLREESLTELSHIPLALLAVTAGWTRWLDLRFPGPARRMPGRIWPVCFALIGIVLLLYREA